MISKILDAYKQWRNRCRTCDVDGIHKSIIDTSENLRERSRVKTVIEYECVQCGTLWVLADNAYLLSKVVRDELYNAWKSQSWIPTSTQVDVLNQIVGASDSSGKSVYFPCSVGLPDGQQINKALLIVTTGDCFGRYPFDQDVSLLHSTYLLSPSDYALPADIRAASLAAPEKSMGYAPVSVKDGKGEQYTLASEMHFVEANGIRGPDLALDETPYHGKNIIHSDWAEMYLICDKFD
jgi:hypothetical protein